MSDDDKMILALEEEVARLRALLQRFYDDGYDREACAAALKGNE